MSGTYFFTLRGSYTEKSNAHGIIGVSDHEVIETLDDVDKFCCEWWEREYDKKIGCPEFDILIEVGFCTCLNEGGSWVGEQGTRRARLKKEYFHLPEDQPERPMDHLGYIMKIDWLRRKEETDLQFEVRNARFKAFLHYALFIKYRLHCYG